MADYQLTATDVVIRTADHVSIPPGHRLHDEYLAWVAAGNAADAYMSPPPDVPPQVTSRQFWTQMAIQGLIDEGEAVDALGGDIPNDIKQFVNQLPIPQRFQARMFFEAPTFERHKRAASDMAVCFSLTPVAIDLFFQNAAAL